MTSAPVRPRSVARTRPPGRSPAYSPGHQLSPAVPDPRWSWAPQPLDRRPRPRSRRNRWLWFLAVIALVAGVAGASAWHDATRPLPTGAPAAGSDVDTIRYEVLGGGEATAISFTTADRAGLAHVNWVSLPWIVDVQFEHGDTTDRTLYLVAQRADQDGGPIGCRIERNSVVEVERQASGPGAIVSCADGVPDRHAA